MLLIAHRTVLPRPTLRCSTPHCTRSLARLPPAATCHEQLRAVPSQDSGRPDERLTQHSNAGAPVRRFPVQFFVSSHPFLFLFLYTLLLFLTHYS